MSNFKTTLVSLTILFNLLEVITPSWGAHHKPVDQNPAYLNEPYEVFITDADVDTLMAHCYSNDDDLGDKELGPNQYFHWRFKMDFLFTTKFFCDFRSLTYDGKVLKSMNLTVFELLISTLCSRGDDPKKCYWLVRNDGFYFSKDNKPFPDGWVRRRKW